MSAKPDVVLPEGSEAKTVPDRRSAGVETRSRTATRVLVASLALGLAGDVLLRVVPWGLNAFLWTAALLVVVVAATRVHGSRLRGEGRWLIAPALLLAAVFVLRDGATLRAWSGLALVATLALLATSARAGRLRDASVSRYLLAPVEAGVHAMAGAGVLLLADLRIARSDRPRQARVLAAVRGAVLAFPVLFVLGALLASADPVFERLLEDVLDVEALFLHGLVTLVAAWLAAGFLRQTLIAQVVTLPGGAERFRVGAMEMGIVLGSVVALFLAFVAVQLRYLFGGSAHVEATLGLTYAEYARRGFFELVAVAALTLPLLIVLDAVRSEGIVSRRLFRALSAAALVLLGVIVASALQRMRLYVAEYGLTELRLYTTVFMLWLAAVCAWFAATALRGARERFTFGAYAGGLVVLLLLAAANPAAWIVHANAARAREVMRFDGWYATSLGADAVPALIEVAPALPLGDRCVVAAQLLELWRPARHVEWRGWNLARARARRAVAESHAKLREMACLGMSRPTS